MSPAGWHQDWTVIAVVVGIRDVLRARGQNKARAKREWLRFDNVFAALVQHSMAKEEPAAAIEPQCDENEFTHPCRPKLKPKDAGLLLLVGLEGMERRVQAPEG